MGSLRRGTWGLCTRAARAALSGRTGGHVWVDMPALGWGTGQGFRSAGGIAGQTWGVRGFASAGGSGDGGNESPVAEQPAAEEGEGEEQQAGEEAEADEQDDDGLEAVSHPPGYTPPMPRPITRSGQPLHRSKKLPRYMKLTYEETLGQEFEDWPEGEEVIGDFDYVYDANALIQERVNDVHDDDYTKELDERDLFHLHHYEDELTPEQREADFIGKPWLQQRIRIIPSPAGFVDPHPLNRKVSMKICVEAMAADLQLTEEQLDRFVILCGPRFKPYRKGMSTAAGMVYMKCDRFEMRHENRRFLLDQLKALLAEARKAGTAEDPLAATADFVQHKAGYEAVVEQHTSALVGALLKLTPEQIEHILATEPEVAKKVLPSLQDLLPHHLRGVSAS